MNALCWSLNSRVGVRVVKGRPLKGEGVGDGVGSSQLPWEEKGAKLSPPINQAGLMPVADVG